MIHKRCEYVHDDPEWQCIKALGHLGEHDYQGKTDWRSEPSAPASAEPTADCYLKGAAISMTYDFEKIHADPLIAREVVIEMLEGCLSEARAGLSRASEYVAVNPNGRSIRRTVLWALDATNEKAIESKLYHE